MNGPEHYREAERLLALALKHQESGLVPRSVDICHAQAQVHATLALAAAQVDAVAAHGPGDVDRSWIAVIWTTPATDEEAGQ